MRILSFHGENIKKLKVVEIEPGPNGVTLSGGNEQGKTSVLDAIEMALQPKEVMKRTPEPIRKGQEKGFSIVGLGDPVYDDNGKEINCKPTLKATRTFTAKGNYLKVENMEGAVFQSPQAILDKLVGQLTFDPLAFSNMEDKKQLETLLKLVKIDLDLEQWAKDRKEVYDERTVVNRLVSDLEGQAKGIVVEEDVPDEEESTSKVLAEQQIAQMTINGYNEMRRKASDEKDGLELLLKEQSSIADEIQKLEQSLIDAKSRLNGLNATINAQINECAKLDEEVKTLVDPDISAFQRRLSEVEETNRKVRAKKDRIRIDENLKNQKGQAKIATMRLEELDRQRAKALADAQMPVDGLSFNDDGVTYNDIPFSQCSSEERLRVSVAMGMALNPKLRVMFIRDGSLLDTKHRAEIQKMAADNQYQLWLEVADDTGKVGLYFEDGEIKKAKKETAIEINAQGSLGVEGEAHPA